MKLFKGPPRGGWVLSDVHVVQANKDAPSLWRCFELSIKNNSSERAFIRLFDMPRQTTDRKTKTKGKKAKRAENTFKLKMENTRETKKRNKEAKQLESFTLLHRKEAPSFPWCPGLSRYILGILF